MLEGRLGLPWRVSTFNRTVDGSVEILDQFVDPLPSLGVAAAVRVRREGSVKEKATAWV